MTTPSGICISAFLVVQMVFCVDLVLASQCVPEDFGYGSVVCVCNATYCDVIEANSRLPAGQFALYTSSKDGQRFQREVRFLTKSTLQDAGSDIVLTLYRNNTFQTVLGFGGAFTDAAAININSLSRPTQDNLLAAYFSNKGIQYSMGRVPMGSCDFSTRPYTYDDGPNEDPDLKQFQLTREDLELKVPLIRRAQHLAARPFALLASPFGAPAWMRTSLRHNGKGTLRGEPGGPYYNAWANYFVRFLEEYAARGIAVWGVTAQNEPLDGAPANLSRTSLGFSADQQRDFIGRHLGPALEARGLGDVKILVLDDQRLMLPQWAQQVLANDSEAARYVAGVAFHWYLNFAVPPTVLSATHQQFPQQLLLSTEASEGAQPWDERPVMPGSWERGENYAHDIIQDFLHWTVGWIDWNLALDQTGGPNWVGTFADSPIIVDAKRNRFLKQPMFYAIGHFSAFIPPGSTIINVTMSEMESDVESLACEGPESSTIVVVLNRSESPRNVLIRNWDGDGSVVSEIPPRAIQTYIWWR